MTRDQALEKARAINPAAEITGRGKSWWIASIGSEIDPGGELLVIEDTGAVHSFVLPVSPWFDDVDDV